MLYRFYWLNANDRIVSAADIDCESDYDARHEASRRIDGYPAVEIWMLDQRIGLVRATGSGSRAA
jgi:hypothetical protein